MVRKTGTKKSSGKKAGAKGLGKATPAAGVGIEALTPSPDAALVGAELTSNQCIVWRQGEFRLRVRRAVAEWAQEPVSNILPSNTLGELAKGTPWNNGQQARLVQSMNANDVFAPPFPETNMAPPSQLLPASTTVAQWEKVVWRHQDPETPCFPFTD